MVQLKKMLFGGMLFLAGLFGMLALFSLSVTNPWGYNDLDGLLGFLMATGSMWAYVIFVFFTLIGLGICFLEAYFGDK